MNRCLPLCSIPPQQSSMAAPTSCLSAPTQRRCGGTFAGVASSSSCARPTTTSPWLHTQWRCTAALVSSHVHRAPVPHTQQQAAAARSCVPWQRQQQPQRSISPASAAAAAAAASQPGGPTASSAVTPQSSSPGLSEASSPSAPDLDPSVYLSAAAQPTHFVGPVAVANIPGKGRGLVATSALSAGQLLLVVPPLVLLEGEMGEIPEHDELVELISYSGALFSPWQAAWLNSLTTTVATTNPLLLPGDSDGDNDSDTNEGDNNCVADSSGGGSSSSSGGGDGMSSSSQQQPVVPDFLPPPGQAVWTWGLGAAGGGVDTDTVAAGAGAGAGADSDSSSSIIRVPFEALGMDEERLWAAIVLNCYGEGFPDLPASLCAGVTPPNSQLGLWGPFSLLNHACCPNAVMYTLRDCMVVRCCAPVAVGEEITINYLGRSVLTPLSQRQTELEACYGFKCDCRRCTAEAAWSSVAVTTPTASIPLPAFLDQLHAQIGEDFEPRRAHIAHMQQQQQQQQQEEEKDTAENQGVASTSSSTGDAVELTQQQTEWQEQLQQLVRDMQEQWEQLQAAARSREAESVSSSTQAGSALQSSQQHLSSHRSSSSSSTATTTSAEEACWVLASAFDLLGLLHDSTEQLSGEEGQQQQQQQQPDSTVLAAIVRVCETVCPGSDLHVFQALRWTSLAQQQEQQQQQHDGVGVQQRQGQGKEGAGGDDGGAVAAAAGDTPAGGAGGVLQESSADAAMAGLVWALQLRYGQQVAADRELLSSMVAAASKAANMVWL